MNNELVPSGNRFSEDQVKLIKSQILPKGTNDELKLFLYICEKTGLDPFAKQIYAIHRKTKDPNDPKKQIDKMTIQTGIDGYRVIAERSDKYAGQGEPVFIYKTIGKVEVLDCCKVTIYKWGPGGQRYEAATGIAFWMEYAGGDMWAKMPHVMLSKVAEANALKKAFPQDLAGLNTSEEMDHVDLSTLPTAPPTKAVEEGGFTEEDQVVLRTVLSLQEATSVDELKDIKNNAPAYVLKKQSFSQAANKRYGELTDPKAVEGAQEPEDLEY